MPRKGGVVTPREREFIGRYAATGDHIYSAVKAGYGQPAARASEALQRPAILAEIRKEQGRILTEEILPLAAGRHKALLLDPATNGQVLIRAIDLAYKYGLIMPQETMSKDPSEWTVEEMELARSQLLDRLANEAKDVTNAQAAPNLFD